MSVRAGREPIELERALGSCDAIGPPAVGLWRSLVQALSIGFDWRPSIVLFILACIGFSIIPFEKALFEPGKHNKDYTLWYESGRRVHNGEQLYPVDPQEGFKYMYPPFAAVCILAPLASVGPAGLTASILAANCVAWAACLMLSVRLVRGRALGQHPMLYILPAVATAGYVWDNFLLGQPNLILLAIMLAGMVLLREGRGALGGVCLGFAIAVKAFPALVVPYLIYRREWRTLATTVAAAAGFLLVAPAPTRGIERNWEELGVWARGMMDPRGTKPAQGHAAACWGNQSLPGVVRRLTQTAPVGRLRARATREMSVGLIELSSVQRELLVGGLAVAAGGGLAWCLPKRRRRTIRSDALEMSAVLILTVLFSPIARTYYFCWLMPGITVWTAIVTDPAVSPRRARLALAMGGAAACLLGSAVLQFFDRRPQALGATAWGSTVLLVCLCWALRSRLSLLNTPWGCGVDGAENERAA